MYIVFILIKTKQKMALSKRGLDTMTYIKSIENEDLTGSEKFDLIKEYFDAWEENQLPDGIEIITNEDGLPEIITKNVEFKKSKNYLLIKEIWEYAKHTHNDKDFEDLMTFDVNELNEILIDYKNLGV
jgi:hypothetical protein